ncbi:MAG: heavy metal-responsive transcriptional regulator [Hapalosiphonaceae cyanobacterium JJU2]|nr:MAG: heavy metal-responsive transcriptional regulator [Hapalosiphonaceae cyanobacterium JJU2]
MVTQRQGLLFIGQIAVESGIPIKTIRYYEELGLLKCSGRTKGGFRLFSPEVLDRLAFIKRAQKLGLSLEEIGEFLKICDEECFSNEEITNKLKDTISEIDPQIQQLRRLEAELKELIPGVQIVKKSNCKTCTNIAEKLK